MLVIQKLPKKVFVTKGQFMTNIRRKYQSTELKRTNF